MDVPEYREGVAPSQGTKNAIPSYANDINSSFQVPNLYDKRAAYGTGPDEEIAEEHSKIDDHEYSIQALSSRIASHLIMKGSQRFSSCCIAFLLLVMGMRFEYQRTPYYVYSCTFFCLPLFYILNKTNKALYNSIIYFRKVEYLSVFASSVYGVLYGISSYIYLYDKKFSPYWLLCGALIAMPAFLARSSLGTAVSIVWCFFVISIFCAVTRSFETVGLVVLFTFCYVALTPLDEKSFRTLPFIAIYAMLFAIVYAFSL